MILVTINFKARSSKQKELVQTVGLLAVRVRTEAGCVSSRFYGDVENENALCVLEEWATEADLDERLRSEYFRVLRGAVKVLGRMDKIKFHSVSQTRGGGSDRASRRVRLGVGLAASDGNIKSKDLTLIPPPESSQPSERARARRGEMRWKKTSISPSRQ